MIDATDRLGILFIIAIAIAILLAAVIGIDGVTAKPVPVGIGVVAAKVYVPASTTTGTTAGISPDGTTVVPVVVTSTSSEQWLIVVEHKAQSFSVNDARLYARFSQGDEAEVLERRGVFGVYGWTIQKPD